MRPLGSRHGTGLIQKMPSRAKTATSPRKAKVMIATVRNTSPIGMRGMGKASRVLRPRREHVKPAKSFGSACGIRGIGFATGQALQPGQIMRVLELSCWCATATGLIVVVAVLALL